jgi:hypothetical protein
LETTTTHVPSEISTGNPGKKKGRWTEKELDALKTFYPTKDNEWLAHYIIGRTASGVRTKAYHLGLKKSAEFLAAMGRSNVSVRYS